MALSTGRPRVGCEGELGRVGGRMWPPMKWCIFSNLGGGDLWAFANIKPVYQIGDGSKILYGSFYKYFLCSL